jgi:aminopeptidase N
MDEGWATFFTRDVEERFQKDNEKKYWERIVSSYENGSGFMLDVPLVVPSFSVKGGFPRVTFYRRPGCAYMALMKMMGKENFKKALLNYIETWNGKHPIPTDFFTCFNNSANEDLAWFWNPWFYEYGVPDLAIFNVYRKDNQAEISIKKVGNIPTRIFIKVTFDDGSSKEIKRSIREWKEKSLITLTFKTDKIIKSVELGNSLIPDIDKTNNVWENK